MAFSVRNKTPRIKQERIILHFDYDCFYAQVVENAQPALKSLPLGIKQKSILATCNYVARARGVRKLQLVSDAKRLCPDLVLADGEDLSAFRDASKRLYRLLRSFAWNGKAERLGLDEIFLDVTDIVDYNVALLNRNALPHSFLCLSRDDPEKGFAFDASAVAGCTVGDGRGRHDHDNLLYVRLGLASHLARFLRLRIEEEGFTSACGISTSKLLSKLAGSVNKPRNQTTLLSLSDADVHAFMDSHALRKVPGIGGKIAHALESLVLAKDDDTKLTVGQFRTSPGVSPQKLEKVLGGRPGSEKGIGEKVWGLLHGADDSEVKTASSFPTQISIEDTYPGPHGGLNTTAEVERELLKLAASLLRRMHVDLAEDIEDGAIWQPTAGWAPGDVGTTVNNKQRKWLANPRTIRLSTRPKTTAAEGKPYNWGRASHSQPLPTFILHDADNQEIVKKLVHGTLLPMFRKLNPDRDGWNIGMINICVANMVPTAAESSAPGSGRDISQMFSRQEAVLREFTAYDDDDDDDNEEATEQRMNDDTKTKATDTFDSLNVLDSGNAPPMDDVILSDAEWEESWGDQDGSQRCARCGHYIPQFATAAHQRYHDFGDH